MAVSLLRKGSRGKRVRDLQRSLTKRGFPTGGDDGIFGIRTLAALRAFQSSESLLIDGIAGRDTLASLGLLTTKEKAKRSGDTRSFTAARVSEMFPDAPRKNIKKYLPAVLKALREAGLDTTPMILMALATIRAETAGFIPISEFQSKYNTSPSGHPFDLYDNRKDLGNRGEPDGALFKGRGFIQLTGRANYTTIGKKIGLGSKLVKDPELANDPKIAAKILAAFLGAKERRIKEALVDNDLRSARKLVNGGSHGLAQFRQCYKVGEASMA